MDPFDAFRTWFRGQAASKEESGSQSSSVAGVPAVSVPTVLPDDPDTLKTIIRCAKTWTQCFNSSIFPCEGHGLVCA